MEAFLIGLAGGIVPGAILMIFYIVLLAGRLAKIETNISWIKEALHRRSTDSREAPCKD